MSIENLISLLVEEVLCEINSISHGGVGLLNSNSINGSSGEGVGIRANGLSSDSNIGDENYGQFGEKDKHKKDLFKFMWDGDNPENKAPKVKYVAV